MMTLKSLSVSPRNSSSLNIPLSSSPQHASPLASPASSAGGKSLPPSSPGYGNSTGYFPPVNRPAPKRISREEAFKTVKSLESALAACNEYRQAVTAVGKAGRKLAGAVKELGGVDKGGVASQTMRPAASIFDSLSDLAQKLAKKIDKEYEEANADASKYFSLLAKESRSHEAYLGAIGKKHDKAEKAYKKASKALSDTSNAHAGLRALKETLSEDITRAHEDHHTLLGTKQSLILLRLASSLGSLASFQMGYFSDGLKKVGASYGDVEYFRSLAEISWQAALPPSLESQQEEESRRDDVRLGKARVVLGERDVVGNKVWDGAALAALAAAGTVGNGLSGKDPGTSAERKVLENNVNKVVNIPFSEVAPKVTEVDIKDGSVPEAQAIPPSVYGTVKAATVSAVSAAPEQGKSSPTLPSARHKVFHTTHNAGLEYVSSVSATADRKSGGENEESAGIANNHQRSNEGGGNSPESLVAERPISRYSDVDFSNHHAHRPSFPSVSSSRTEQAPGIAASVSNSRPAPIPLPWSPSRRTVSQIAATMGGAHGHSHSVSQIPNLTPQRYGHEQRQSHGLRHAHAHVPSEALTSMDRGGPRYGEEFSVRGTDRGRDLGSERDRERDRGHGQDRGRELALERERELVYEQPYYDRIADARRSRRVTMPVQAKYTEPSFVVHHDQPHVQNHAHHHSRERERDDDFYYDEPRLRPRFDSLSDNANGAYRQPLVKDQEGGVYESEGHRRAGGMIAPRPVRALGSDLGGYAH